MWKNVTYNGVLLCLLDCESIEQAKSVWEPIRNRITYDNKLLTMIQKAIDSNNLEYAKHIAKCLVNY